MPRHRALATTVRRGVARWPFAVAGLIALLLLGWLGLTWVNGTLERRTAARTHSCPEGDSILRVAAAPNIADAVLAAAKRWNEQDVVIRDQCIRAEVASLDTKAVFAGLTGEWNTAALGPRPHAWLPESSVWANRLAAANSALAGSTPESVASSPVVLAVPDEAVEPLDGGDSFVYGDLAALTSAPDGWARYGKPGWGRFTVAMPDPADNVASVLAIQCAIAGASPQRAGPVTVETLTLPAVQQNLTQLAAARPGNTPATPTDALIALGTAGQVQGAPDSAVPGTEVDLYRRNLGLDGKPASARPLYGIAARGPSPAADFPFLPLTGDEVDQEQLRAARKFREFLKETEQQRAFNRAGLRAAGGAEYPPGAPGIRWDSATTSLVPADANTTQQISASWSNTADGGQVVTVLVDASRSMLTDGGAGRSRMDWVKAALHGFADRMATGSLGVWEFSRKLDGDKAYRRLVPTRPVAEQRAALAAGIDALTPATGTQLYSGVEAVYESAVANFVEGKRNRVVVITDGRDDGGAGLSQVRNRLDDGKVPVSFIALGPDPDRRALAELARAAGGTVSALTDATGMEAALGQLMS
ncbi:MAG: substrate-binding domain-containing protein [Kibdelosporangium sp.]